MTRPAGWVFILGPGQLLGAMVDGRPAGNQGAQAVFIGRSRVSRPVRHGAKPRPKSLAAKALLKSWAVRA